ncbi:MAG: hypothetical protein F9B45_01605 [Phycisphaera sp. RhM]|nr:hypothetical protein [Phycisphaera sp. RhM]
MSQEIKQGVGAGRVQNHRDDRDSDQGRRSDLQQPDRVPLPASPMVSLEERLIVVGQRNRLRRGLIINDIEFVVVVVAKDVRIGDRILGLPGIGRFPSVFDLIDRRLRLGAVSRKFIVIDADQRDAGRGRDFVEVNFRIQVDLVSRGREHNRHRRQPF